MSVPAFDNVLDACLAVRNGEQVVLIIDDGTDEAVVDGLREGVGARGAVPVVARIPVPALPGSEPPTTVAAMMFEAGAIIELTSLFIGSSLARRRATGNGARYLAMPGVRLETFRDGGPLTVDFAGLRARVEDVGTAWTRAGTFRLTTPAGTDLRGSVEGRPGRVLHGVACSGGDYMAPPDIEAGTAPLEGSTNGVVVVDADLLFMGVGPLPEPVVLHIRDGELAGIEGSREAAIDRDDRPVPRQPHVQPRGGVDGVQPRRSSVRCGDGDGVGARHRAHRPGQLACLRRDRRRGRTPRLRDARGHAGAGWRDGAGCGCRDVSSRAPTAEPPIARGHDH